jgi:hypothetical protein
LRTASANLLNDGDGGHHDVRRDDRHDVRRGDQSVRDDRSLHGDHDRRGGHDRDVRGVPHKNSRDPLLAFVCVCWWLRVICLFLLLFVLLK